MFRTHTFARSWNTMTATQDGRMMKGTESTNIASAVEVRETEILTEIEMATEREKGNSSLSHV